MSFLSLGLSLASIKAGGAKALTYVTEQLKLYFNFAKETVEDSYTGHEEVQFASTGSIEFDGGNGSYINAGTAIGDSLGNNYAGDFSISVWFKPDVITGGSFGIFNLSPLGDDSDIISLWLTDSDIYWDIRDVGSGDYYRLIHDCPAAGKWTHLVCTYEAGVGLEMYIDGSVVSGTATGSGPTIADMDFTGLKTHIGGYYNDGYTFNGKLANVGFWSRLLSAEEALSVMHKKYADLGVTEKLSLEGWWGLDESQHSTEETLLFDGTGDYVSIDYHDDWKFAGGFTWAIWFRVTKDGGSTARGNLIGVSGSQSSSYGQPYGLTLETASLGNIWFYVGTGGGTNISDSLSYNDGDYHLVVATMDDNPNGTLRLYFDGTLEKTSTVTHTVGAATGSGQTIAHHGGDLWFGSSGTNPAGQDFGGHIPQVAIWNEALSQTNITSLQNLGLNGDMKSISSSSCIGYWKMDNATTCQDLTSNDRDATVTGATLVGYVGAKDSSTNARHGDTGNGLGCVMTKSIYGNNAPKLPRSIDVATETFGDAIGLGSYSFDGSADWIDCGGTGAGNNFLHNITSFTIGAWFRVDGGNDGAIFSNYNSTDGIGILFAHGYSATGNFDCRIGYSASNVDLKQTSSPAVDGKWHYGAVTLGSNVAKLYLDGLEVHSLSATSATDIKTTEPNNFGVRHPNGTPDTKFEGRMAQIGIWTRTLTRAEINSVKEKAYSDLTIAEKVDLESWHALDVAPVGTTTLDSTDNDRDGELN